ncbi:MAG: universal stress protein UspE [Gammaproteobacteria bacterium]|nr:universal stress protein UspE [Gammaproteobacteria bacterium]
MATLSKFLAVIDKLDEAGTVLARAAGLAEAHQARVDVLLTLHEPSLELGDLWGAGQLESLRDNYVAEHRQKLEPLLEPLRGRGLGAELYAEWDSTPFMPIIRAVQARAYDLVIKAAKAHSRLTTFFYTPTDWHLLRKCPCPVLMTKGPASGPARRILAAVEPVASDAEHAGLNHAILDMAQFLAGKLGAELHVINAFSVIPVGTAFDGTGIYHEDYVASVRELHQKRLAELVQPYGVAEARVHLRQGVPADVIPEFVAEENIELVILGTLARSGMAGIFIGNTAESVLDELHCDVLTVKQPGFVAPA